MRIKKMNLMGFMQMFNIYPDDDEAPLHGSDVRPDHVDISVVQRARGVHDIPDMHASSESNQTNPRDGGGKAEV